MAVLIADGETMAKPDQHVDDLAIEKVQRMSLIV